jgi:hypothetical protein
VDESAEKPGERSKAPPTDGGLQPSEREARLAAALRDNLRRRKGAPPKREG